MKVTEAEGTPVLKETNLKSKAKKRNIVVFTIGFLVILLIVGTFIAGRLLGEDLNFTGSEDKEFVDLGDGMIAGTGVRLEPASELPKVPPAASGQFHHREDNVLFINQFPPTGQIVFLDELDTYPMMEIVITNDTLIFKDITDLTTAKGGVVQQVVTLVSVEDMEDVSTVAIWGEERGDRIVADVIQYFP
ncbi:MAG: hypothetical protein GTO18_02575 [Anaerolineales bacterium]|nr:hypothetical protein [Anaerolineales bacterium]